MSISVRQLSKTYHTQKALDQVSFEISSCSVTGLLGPNGAGKSTLMKILTGYLPPSSGHAFVCGLDVVQSSMAVRRIVGYLPEHNPLYLDMYVKEYLMFAGSIHLDQALAYRRMLEMIELTGLGDECHKKLGALSKGYRQRVGIAQALMHRPDVLILDEPTAGLDPNQLEEIRHLIKEMGKDKTVLFSSHILQEVEAICDQILIIDHGKLVANDTLSNLIQNQSLANVFHQVTHE